MRKFAILLAIISLFVTVISCSKDDDIQIEPKVENPNYLRDSLGNFEIKNGLYLEVHGTLGASHTSYIFSAQENNVGIYLCWEIPTNTSSKGTFDISSGFYINPNEVLFGQSIEGTVTIDKIDYSGTIPDKLGVRPVRMEGSYSFVIHGYNSVAIGRSGTFHYEGEYPHEY